METTFLVLTIFFANSIETWHERTAFAAVCHGQALQMAQKAAAQGWSIRYSCNKSIVMKGVFKVQAHGRRGPRAPPGNSGGDDSRSQQHRPATALVWLTTDRRGVAARD
jgi:hypothetical protein